MKTQARTYGLVKKILRINFSDISHCSIYFWLIASIAINAILQIYFGVKQSGTGQEDNIYNRTTDLIFIFFFFFIAAFLTGFLIHEQISNQNRTGVFLNFFSTQYSRKQIFVAKITVIYLEIALAFLLSFLTFLVCTWITYAATVPSIGGTTKDLPSQIGNLSARMLVVAILFAVFAFLIYMPLFLYLSLRLRPYWFTVSIVAIEALLFGLLVLPIIIVAITGNSSKPESSVSQYTFFVIGIFSPYYWMVHVFTDIFRSQLEYTFTSSAMQNSNQSASAINTVFGISAIKNNNAISAITIIYSVLFQVLFGVFAIRIFRGVYQKTWIT